MIFLVQHGKAYTEAEDPERRLTPKGIAETEKVARHLAAAGVRPAEIIHSGKTRARQTAEILARHLGAPVREGEGLGPTTTRPPGPCGSPKPTTSWWWATCPTSPGFPPSSSRETHQRRW